METLGFFSRTADQTCYESVQSINNAKQDEDKLDQGTVAGQLRPGGDYLNEQHAS